MEVMFYLIWTLWKDIRNLVCLIPAVAENSSPASRKNAAAKELYP